VPNEKGSHVNIWTDLDRRRYFLIPRGLSITPGAFPLSSLTGEVRFVHPHSILPFQITEDQARRWAKDELGRTLEELKHGIDEKLAHLRRQLDERNRTPATENSTVTPSAAPALFDLLKKLPRVITNSLSRDEKRVESAKTAMADLQQRLMEAGINLDDRFSNFPDRLADLRKDVEEERTAKKSAKNEPPRDKQ
jgi:hypothetical protein